MNDRLSRFSARLDSAEPREVSVGYRRLILFGAEQLDSEQVGYSRDAQGRDLTGGGAAGEWRDSWVVFGHEDECGDPVFVDLATPGLPVYTAVHGTGAWAPKLLASSFENFLVGLHEIAIRSSGRSNPIELEGSPLSLPERAELVNALRCLGPDVDLEFWEGWFEV